MNSESGLPVLLSFTDFKTHKNLIDQYVITIILINPMFNALYQDIRLGHNLVYYYGRRNVDINEVVGKILSNRQNNEVMYKDLDIAPMRSCTLPSLIDAVRDSIHKTITPVYGLHQMIQLNKSGTAYLMIDHLPLQLMTISSFEAIYALHPPEKHKIIMYETEVAVNR